MNSKEPLTDEVTKWVAKEINQLSGSTLRLALLAIIDQHQATGIYGFTIGEELSSATRGELDGTKATFYAILRRLEADKLVTSTLQVSPDGPARKYYRLTSTGKRALNALWENWIHYYKILNRLIES
ncbi:MAG: PadR family transcriptional regulator [Candidatus Hodarchaeales archaeon]|jgi:PadR family transcriptional regulator PadR